MCPSIISPVSTLTIYTVFSPPGSLLTWCPPTTVCTPQGSPTQPSSRPTSSRSPLTVTSAPSTAREFTLHLPVFKYSNNITNWLTSDPSYSQETSGCEKRGGKEEAATHKETSERVHALHEGNESQSGGRMHTERERSYQPDPRPKGERYPHYIMQSSSRLSQLLRPQIAVLSAVEKHCLFMFLFLCNCNLA